jgi:hypothetical protein
MIENVGNEAKLGSCMAVALFGTPDHLFVLAGYENCSAALWEIKENKSTLLWTQKQHNEPSKHNFFFLTK